MWHKLRWWLVGSAAVAGSAAVLVTQPAKEEVVILRGLSHYSSTGWPANELADALRKEGYKVRIGNHTEGDDLTKLPNVLIGHSMGGNAALKAVNRFIAQCDAEYPKADDRKKCYATRLPRVVVSLDAGKFPLHSYGPKGQATRCVSLHGGLRPIGGQRVLTNCDNYLMKGVGHSTFPQHPKVVDATVRLVNINRPMVKQ